ncbi:MAG: SIS domain-containing protein [Acidobacteria bacterium]|nr:MAG: SIS domain-containing protein [Acidobacteriota bacterium]RPJ76575.1 MAG: SIS domain-containing protein [Acidobacteriota bacterium]
MADSILLSEIAEQPETLRRLLAEGGREVSAAAAAVGSRRVRHVVIAARGSSDNAARYAQYVFGAFNRLTVTLATPSLFTRYGRPPLMEGALVVGISQSGESPDLLAVVEEGRRQGCLTLAITNAAGSPLSLVADHTIHLRAGAERSVAATKTYTAQITALAMLSAAIAEDGGRLRELQALPGQVARALEVNDQRLLEAAEALKDAGHGVVIGRGYNYATAFEISLKAKELAYVAVEPYSSADFQHGPIALIETGFAAIVVNVAGAVSGEVEELLREMVRRGTRPVVLSNLDSSLGLAAAPLRLPAALPEWLSPVAAVVPGQLLAFHLSRARGFNPDQPRGLKKVTRTS